MRRTALPLTTIILLTILWVVLMTLWIVWYVVRRQEYRDLAARYQPELLSSSGNWLTLAQGIILLFLILAGSYAIFIFWKRQADLYIRQTDALAQITHELKSPLASIRLHLETIRLRNPEQEKLDRFIDTMLADTERLDAMITNLLITARLERKNREIHPKEVDLSLLLSTWLERFREKLPAGGILSTRIEPGIRVSLDRESFETALRNLLENAIIYSPDAPEITVSLSRHDGSCRLVVQDRGVGIPPSELRKIFDIFYRVRTPGDQIKGSGLGLHIVRSVITEHGGKIWGESDGVGKGSRFVIQLPIRERSHGSG